MVALHCSVNSCFHSLCIVEAHWHIFKLFRRKPGKDLREKLIKSLRKQCSMPGMGRKRWIFAPFSTDLELPVTDAFEKQNSANVKKPTSFPYVIKACTVQENKKVSSQNNLLCIASISRKQNFSGFLFSLYLATFFKSACLGLHRNTVYLHTCTFFVLVIESLLFQIYTLAHCDPFLSRPGHAMLVLGYDFGRQLAVLCVLLLYAFLWCQWWRWHRYNIITLRFQ